MHAVLIQKIAGWLREKILLIDIIYHKPLFRTIASGLLCKQAKSSPLQSSVTVILPVDSVSAQNNLCGHCA